MQPISPSDAPAGKRNLETIGEFAEQPYVVRPIYLAFVIHVL